MEYDLLRPWKTLDDWQKEYIKAEGNCFLLCGRQSGKTTAMSIKFGKRAAETKNKIIMMIAFTEKQAYNLFFKTLMYLQECYPKQLITKGPKKPTKHRINLKNGSTIMCYAAGLTGEGLRTFTLTDLVIDEAAPMSREVFISVSPMLSVTGGTMDISSTPRGKEGYFYECSKRDDYTKFYVSAEECPRHKKEFLDAEKTRMSKLEYAQEYLAMFLDDLKRVFSDELIGDRCVINSEFEQTLKHLCGPPTKKFLGCDIAGLGGDENTFEILGKSEKGNLYHITSLTSKRKLTTETTDEIIRLEKLHDFTAIGVDDGGAGFGVFSELITNNLTKRKSFALNNASRPLDRDGSRSKKLLKEDMYMNLVALMEQKKIQLLNDNEVIASLKSIQYEYVIKAGKQTTLRIFGRYSHIAEGLIRSAWLATQDKSLKPCIY